MRRPVTICLALFALATGVRIAARLYVGFSAPLGSDELQVVVPAHSLAHGTGLSQVPQLSPDGALQPTAFRMPLPSLLLAPVFLVTDEVAALYWVMIVSTATAAPLMYLLTRAGFGERVGAAAGVGWAVHPTWAYFSIQPLSDSFFIPAMLLALLLTARLRTADRWPGYAACGLAWGAALLVRPHALAIGGLVAVGYLAARRPRVAAAIAAGMAVCLAPWVVRNYVVFDRVILLATEGGETLLGANNPHVTADPALRGMWVAPLSIPEYREKLAGAAGEYERDRMQQRMALDFFAANPGRIPRLAVDKMWRWLTPVTATGGAVRVLVLVSYGGLLAAVAVGLFRGAIRRSPLLTLATLGTAALSVLTVVYWGNLTRGRLPLEALWFPLAAQGVFGRPAATSLAHPEVT